MCGICGIVNFKESEPVEEKLLRDMNQTLVHRGPDEEGYYCQGSVGLAIRRLSVIDLATGHQPISNEEGSVWVVFNGEIYNFLQLKSDLVQKGHRFKTNSDTEVIVHLYEEMGVDFVQKLRGMFAIALWDNNNKRLVLVRDRIGKKPLIYSLLPGRIAFASELRTLLLVPGVSKDMDLEALDLYMTLQYIPSPRTIFQSIKKLPPAHMLVWDGKNVEIRRYWDLSWKHSPSLLTQDEARQILLQKLKESIRLRMVSDVPLGAFLSGGIDSSCVVALMSEMSSRPVKTFTIGFEEQNFSELRFAREVAQAYGCDHHEIMVRPEMAEVLPQLVWHYGEPYADSGALPAFYVARETRRHVTVALNGDGGDEIFAGYPRYASLKLLSVWDHLPLILRRGMGRMSETLSSGKWPYLRRVRRFLESTVLASQGQRYLNKLGSFSEEQKKLLYSKDMKQALGKEELIRQYLDQAFQNVFTEDSVNQWLYRDLTTYLPECLMVKIDIATMANSLEARSPFLDHELVEFAFSLPGHWKLKGLGKSKWILKEAMAKYLSPKILHRSKMGFGIPLETWLRRELRDYWKDHVLSGEAIRRGYFEEKTLKNFFEEHVSGKKNHGMCLWTLLMLELWHRAYLPDGRL